MIASHQRQLRDGREFSRLFPTGELENTNPILLKSGDTFDTLTEMERIIRRYQADTGAVAKQLRGVTLEATCRNVWEWCYHHFQYRQDDAGVEQLRRPLRAWKDRVRGIDCDCYSILISTILLNLGIPHKLRKAKYNGKSYYQHIYVIVPETVGSRRYYTIDPVVDQFNYETPFTAKFDKSMMPIQFLNGVPAGPGPLCYAVAGSRYRPGFGAEFSAIGSGLAGGLGKVDSSGYTQQKEFEMVFEQAGIELLAATKLHLENTRAEILSAKETSLYPFAGQIKQVVMVWENPTERDRLLEAFSREEQGLNGWLGDAWNSVTGAVKQASGWVGDKVGQAANAVAQGVTNAATWVGDKAKDLGKLIVRFNPLSIVIRNALLLAWKLNLLRMSERLAVGYLDESAATAAGLNLSEWRKAKDTVTKVVAVFEGLQGEKNNVRDAVMDGYRRGTSNHGVQRIPGLGEPATAAAGTAAATPIIVKIMQWLSSINFSNLFAVFRSQGKAVDTNYPPPPPNDYLMPGSEQQYLANQQQYDNPKAADNTMKYVAGAAAVGLLYWFTLGPGR